MVFSRPSHVLFLLLLLLLLLLLQIKSIAASRHAGITTLEGALWTMGHNDSKGGGGHGSPPIDAAGQLGRGGDRKPALVSGLQVGKGFMQKENASSRA